MKSKVHPLDFSESLLREDRRIELYGADDKGIYRNGVPEGNSCNAPLFGVNNTMQANNERFSGMLDLTKEIHRQNLKMNSDTGTRQPIVDAMRIHQDTDVLEQISRS